jgi:hypothetical protein
MMTQASPLQYPPPRRMIGTRSRQACGLLGAVVLGVTASACGQGEGELISTESTATESTATETAETVEVIDGTPATDRSGVTVSAAATSAIEVSSGPDATTGTRRSRSPVNPPSVVSTTMLSNRARRRSSLPTWVKECTRSTCSPQGVARLGLSRRTHGKC